MTIKLVVGLQNPGASYEQTRHNAGGWFAHALADALDTTFKLNKAFLGEVATAALADTNFYILVPNTWMNQSGRAVRAISQFYRIKPEEILIAHDELDLPAGTARLKTGGGHGGHNGLRDIIAQLNDKNFHRLRLGIGHPGQKPLVHDYVLGKPSVADKHAINDAIAEVIGVMPDVIQDKMAHAMNKLHTAASTASKE